MAKISVRNRNDRRIKKVNKYRDIRDQLRNKVRNIHLNESERWDAMLQLQKLPRDSSPSRRRNRCLICGRPRAYNRLTGLCRLHMRIAVINGFVPGMLKGSW